MEESEAAVTSNHESNNDTEDTASTSYIAGRGRCTVRCGSPDDYFKPNKAGKKLSSGQQQIMLNVYAWLRMNQALIQAPLQPKEAACRAAEMCGVSVRSLYKAKKTIRDGKELTSPTGTKFYLVPKINSNTLLDDFNKSAVRRKVHECFFRKERVTVKFLRSKIVADHSIPKMSKTTMRKCLKLVGFRYEGTGQNKVWTEREEIIFWRRDYLRQIRQRRLQGKSIVYLDETWFNSARMTYKAPKTAREAFIDGLITGSNIPAGKGGRSIVLHNNKNDGSTGSVQIIFLAKRGEVKNSEIDGDHFRKWVENELLPNFPVKCVIVMDNPSYHPDAIEPLPDQTAKKCTIQAWLNKKNIRWTAEMSKGELYAILMANQEQAKKYIIDHLLQKAGHEVFRIPPYHSELNPIELAWGKIKKDIALTTAKLQTKEEQEKMMSAIKAMNTEMWTSFMGEVMEIEENFWLVDCVEGDREALGFRLDDHECDEDTDEEDMDE